MKTKKMKTPKEIFKEADRLARQPDRFLADPLKIDFPVHYLILALKVRNTYIGDGLGFANFVRGTK
jgi:hypothetical protein